jgi:EthD domain
MIKIIMLMKKRADITREEFIDYYDNKHVPFMHKILSKGAAIHRRNFVIPHVADLGGADNLDADTGRDYDVICEVFYENKEAADSVMRDYENPEIARLTELDEANFVMPGSIKRYVVDVHETVFRPMPGGV